MNLPSLSHDMSHQGRLETRRQLPYSRHNFPVPWQLPDQHFIPDNWGNVGDGDPKESLTTIPVSTPLFFFFLTLSKKITTAPFIRAADIILLYQTTSPTAKLQSATEHGKVEEILKPCIWLRSPNATMLQAHRPATAGRSQKTPQIIQNPTKQTFTTPSH